MPTVTGRFRVDDATDFYGLGVQHYATEVVSVDSEVFVDLRALTRGDLIHSSDLRLGTVILQLYRLPTVIETAVIGGVVIPTL